MSEQADKNTPAVPLTRAQRKAQRRARQAAWRQSPAGKRRIAGRQAGYQDRAANLAELPAVEQALFDR